MRDSTIGKKIIIGLALLTAVVAGYFLLTYNKGDKDNHKATAETKIEEKQEDTKSDLQVDDSMTKDLRSQLEKEEDKKEKSSESFLNTKVFKDKSGDFAIAVSDDWKYLSEDGVAEAGQISLVKTDNSIFGIYDCGSSEYLDLDDASTIFENEWRGRASNFSFIEEEALTIPKMKKARLEKFSVKMSGVTTKAYMAYMESDSNIYAAVFVNMDFSDGQNDDEFRAILNTFKEY